VNTVRTSNAFTLVEMAIVLLIITIVGAVAFPKFDSFQMNRKSEYFISAFQKNILRMQQKAITEGRSYRLIINNENHSYWIRGDESGKLITCDFPEFITFESHSMPLLIQYNQFGNISGAGTMYIHTPKQTYKMVFQIGKGKFYVEKQ
jgi:competence protein ComGD